MTDMTPAYDALARLSYHHEGGHRCYDDRWYNPRTGSRVPCPALTHLTTLRTTLTNLREQTHRAAQDPAAVRAVAEGMTGLTMADLGGEDRGAWETTARWAIEALAEHLHPTPAQEAHHG